MAVQVVTQIEHLRESGAGEVVLAPTPGAIGDEVRCGERLRRGVEGLYARAARRLERGLVLVELMVAGPAHGPLDRGIGRPAGIEQAGQPPRGLAGGAAALVVDRRHAERGGTQRGGTQREAPHERAIDVGVRALAEAAVGVLHALHPRDGALDRGMVVRKVRVCQAAEGLPRAI